MPLVQQDEDQSGEHLTPATKRDSASEVSALPAYGAEEGRDVNQASENSFHKKQIKARYAAGFLTVRG